MREQLRPQQSPCQPLLAQLSVQQRVLFLNPGQHNDLALPSLQQLQQPLPALSLALHRVLLVLPQLVQ